MTGAIIGLLAGIALLFWVLGARAHRGGRCTSIDLEELEAAEREVRDLGTSALPARISRATTGGPARATPSALSRTARGRHTAMPSATLDRERERDHLAIHLLRQRKDLPGQAG